MKLNEAKMNRNRTDIKSLESSNSDVKKNKISTNSFISTNEDEDYESSILPRTVTEDRKNDLLREARSNRLAWIQSVPLPYFREGGLLNKFHIVKELPSVTKILTYLYGQPLTSSRFSELVPQRDGSAIRSGEEILEDELAESLSLELETILQDYEAFVQQIKQPESAAIVNGLRHSLSNVDQSNLTVAIRNLIVSTWEQFQRQQGPKGWTKRSLESFLYGQTQAIINKSLKNEKNQDKDCHLKLQQLSFVTPEHLDLTYFGDLDMARAQLSRAISLLLSMQTFHSPYEKLQIIFNCYHQVNEALTKAQIGKPPSADDVLPALILTVLQGQPKHLVSNLRMIEIYASPEYLRGEAGYAYTSLYGAVQFLLELNLKDENPSSLTISAQDFRKGLKASQFSMEKQLDVKRRIQDPIDITTPKSFSIPVSEVRAARLRGEDISLEWAQAYFVTDKTILNEKISKEEVEQDLLLPGFTRNYSFLAARPEDIRMSELPQLLGEYRTLVRAIETLLANRAQKASSERKARLKKAEKAIEENALKLGLGFIDNGR
mmetsp:Transcript_38597/g.44061  ORF Transcript_38597/g.44061 Transcript_38597/m.44061 type:complete len:548 (-) Transcript_38597:27-1670(-)